MASAVQRIIAGTGAMNARSWNTLRLFVKLYVSKERDSAECVVTRGETPEEETPMLRKILIAGAVTLGLTAPTLAAEFYVVHDTATKKCTIVDKKPTVTTTTIVGDGKVYKTREEAETGMKSVKVCTTN
jgi:hypothetical protein